MLLTSNIASVLRSLEQVEAALPAGLLKELAKIPREQWRAAAEGALAVVRNEKNTDFIGLMLATVMVLPPHNGPLTVGLKFPADAFEAAKLAGRKLNTIYARRGRPSRGTVNGESQMQRRVREAGGPAAIKSLERQLTFARQIVQMFVETPESPDSDDPESGKRLTEADRLRLNAPDPFGREANALMGHLMILLGFYPPWHPKGHPVSPNFEAASARIAARVHKFAVATLGDDYGGPFPGANTLRGWLELVLAAWRELVHAALPAAFRGALVKALKT